MSVARHTAYNFVGAVAPVAVTIFVLPIYLETIGAARYGILAILWTINGSLGFLSLGMGPALTQRMAAARHATPAYRSQLVWTALLPSLAASIAGALLVILIGSIYFDYFSTTPSALEAEIKLALPLAALALPFMLCGGVFVGALQARRDFLILNAFQIFSAVFTALVPLAVALTLGPELPGLVAGTVAVNAVATGAAAIVCKHRIPIRRPAPLRRRMLRKLLGFGGWMSLTTFLAPILMTVDRLLIGALRGPAQVAAYVIPYSLTQRLVLLPASLTAALFPHLAASRGADEQRLQSTGIDALSALLTPAAIGGIAILPPFLHWWVGADLAGQASAPGIILAVGFWMHGIAHVASTILLGRARPDIIAKYLLGGAIPYLAILYFLTERFGIAGAAVAWSVRASADLTLFYWTRIPRPSLLKVMASLLLVVSAAIAALALDWRTPTYWLAPITAGALSLALYHRLWTERLIAPSWRRVGAFAKPMPNNGEF